MEPRSFRIFKSRERGKGEREGTRREGMKRGKEENKRGWLERRVREKGESRRREEGRNINCCDEW